MRTFNEQYIDGRWRSTRGAAWSRPLINPATEQPVAIFRAAGHRDIEAAVRAAQRAFPGYADTTRKERVRLIQRIAGEYERRFDEVALAITTEIGAPYEQSAKRLQAREGLRHLQAVGTSPNPENSDPDVHGSTFVDRPAGVYALITPRHDAVAHILCSLVSAMLAGCTAVIKPSSRAPLSARLIAEIVHQAGVPAGIINLVFGSGAETGAQLTAHPLIDRVSFIGSHAAAGRVAREVSGAIKPLSLTLRRMSVEVMLDDDVSDPDITRSVQAAMQAGADGVAACARLLVPIAKLKEAQAIAADATHRLIVGDPLDARTTMGPVSSADQLQRVQEMIATRISQGADLLAGGLGRPRGLDQGYYVRPTVFSARHGLMHETRFDEVGPLLTIMAYRDEHEAIAIVNRNITGSVCRIWCRDTPRAQAVARQMRASLVLVNDAGHGAQTRSAPCQWDVGNVLQQPRHAGFIRRQTIIGPTVTPRHTTDFNEESP